MSVKLRMRRMGTKKRPFWRIVAIDTRSARDGRFIDIVGYYNPMVDPAELKVDEDKVYRWLDNGALPTPKVEQLLRKLGLMERWRMLRAGVTIQDLDAKIAEKRVKQPKRVEGKEKKKRPVKRARAAAEKAAAEASAPKEGEKKARPGKKKAAKAAAAGGAAAPEAGSAPTEGGGATA